LVEVIDDSRAWQVRTDALVEAGPGHAAPLTGPVEPFEQETASVMQGDTVLERQNVLDESLVDR